MQTLLTLPLQLLLIGFAGLVLCLQLGNAIFNSLQALLGFVKDQLSGTQVCLCLPQGLLGRGAQGNSGYFGYVVSLFPQNSEILEQELVFHKSAC